MIASKMERGGSSGAAGVAALFSLCVLLVSLAEEPGYGEFTAELRGRELVVGSTCTGSYSGSADTTRIPCEIEPGTVSPLVHLKTCLRTSPYSPTDDSELTDSATVFSASDTLVIHLGQHENFTTAAGCHWTLELSENFLESLCIDVDVADFTTTVPPLKGISKRIWMLPNVEEETNITAVPQCLENTELLQWSAVRSASCSGDTRSFSPSQIYSLSTTETFVTANSSILYRPCSGCMWYQLLLPISSTIISFTHINNIFYAVLTLSESGGAEVWLGVTGLSPLLRAYPSSDLDWMWSRDPTALNSFLMSASLAQDLQGNLVAVNDGGEEVQLPVSLLLSYAFYNSFTTSSNSSLVSSLHLSTNEDLLSLEDRPHPLLHLPQTSLLCLLTSVVVEAPVCDRVTRSVVEIGRAGFLESVDRDLLPWVNCGVMSNALPTDVFLRLGESYVFTVHLVINPLLAGEVGHGELELVPTLSRPGAVEVAIERTFQTTNNSVMCLVSIREGNGSGAQTQVPPATILRSVDIHFQVRGVGMECVHPLNPHPELLGRLETRVHVGCPPGLSLVFDHLKTQAHDNQFCSPTDNISCYYSGNAFRPVMELVDSVTGERSAYTGPYTLRVLAGGVSRSDMQNFNSDIQREIWTAAADDIISQGSNKIEWTCGLNSPCGEILPGSGGSPEYYLLLQASNRVVGQTDSYCDLTVEFTIRLHGLSMGPITTSVTLILLLVVLVVPLVSLFLLWLWRERREEGKVPDEVEEETPRDLWYRRWMTWGGELVAQLGVRVKELARETQRPLEPHLHTE